MQHAAKDHDQSIFDVHDSLLFRYKPPSTYSTPPPPMVLPAVYKCILVVVVAENLVLLPD